MLRRKPRITLRVDGRRMELVSHLGIREGNTGITSSSEDLGADQNATTSEYDWIEFDYRRLLQISSLDFSSMTIGNTFT